MTVIHNHHNTGLGLPMGGPELRAGSDTHVDRWSQIKEHAVVQQWLAAGVLEVIQDEEAEAEAARVAAEAEQARQDEADRAEAAKAAAEAEAQREADESAARAEAKAKEDAEAAKAAAKTSKTKGGN